MPNFGAKILGNAVSGLNASQAQIAVIGNNISNVNTPGYARRTVEPETRPDQSAGIALGNGVDVNTVRRSVDEYIETVMRDANGSKHQDELKNDYLARIDGLFDLTGVQQTIGTQLNAFFESLNQLTINPSSLDLRTNVIQRGNDLVNAIKGTFNTIASVQTELDQRLTTEVESLNSITEAIADLNGKVAAKEASGTTAADERDQRDQLLNKLAEKISFQKVETSNGMINVTLASGFPLVAGTTSRPLALTESPSFATGTLPSSLGGGVLRYVVYNYDTAGTGQLDLTQTLQSGSGSIGGILQLRGYAAVTNTSSFQADGALVQAAARIEAITRQLMTTINHAYRGPDEISGGIFTPSSVDLNGNAPPVFGLFGSTFAGALDADGDGVSTLTDLTTVGLDNYSSRLTFGVTDPRTFAAGLDVGPSGATGDGFLVLGPGDARNAQNLMTLRTQSQSFAVGSYSLTGTFDEAYNELVTYVGNQKATADVKAKVSNDNYIAAANRRDEISAVSLDEEFTALILAQKTFQSSAKMIRTADELLRTITDLI